MDYVLQGSGLACNIMAKPAGSLCNLNCTYCYYLEKKNLFGPGTGVIMNDEVLESFISQYIQIQKVPLVTFLWQGGEPTFAGIDFYKKVIRLQHKYAEGKKIENAFQTNGVNLDEQWASFLAENHFLVGISIDGPEEIHDYYRKDKQDRKTYGAVMRGIELLHKYRVEFNTLTTVNNISVKHPLEVYRFLKQIGSGFIQFLPVVERRNLQAGISDLALVNHTFTGPALLTEWSLRQGDYGQFLTRIFDEWVRHDVGRTFVQLFDVTLANWIGQMPGLCVFAETCGDALAIEKNGDVFSCDHFVYPEYKLGNILESPLGSMIAGVQQKEFGQAKREHLPGYCIACEYRFACNGECPKHRFMKAPDGEPGLNYLCEDYWHFFGHVHPYMQYMAGQLAKKQAPANVMGWFRHMEAPKTNAPKMGNTGRNEPCPCGSGKKFKHCCMNSIQL